MPWCPVCKAEYGEGSIICADCNEQLVETSPDELSESFDCISVYLTTTSDIPDADIIESLLLSHNIPIEKRFREAGEYLKIYMGGTCFGIDIYVPRAALQKAKDILKFENEDESPLPEITDEEIKCNTKYKRNRRIKVWIILLLFVPGFIFWLIRIIIAIFLHFYFN